MGNQKPELIVMLTHNDQTVEKAKEIFELCQDSEAQFWGFKDVGLPLDQMKDLFQQMKNNGKKTFLEVVSYSEKEGLTGAKMAVECGCDILMGTVFFDSINEYCLANKLKYMPFVGKVTEHPSILDGTISEMLEQAETYFEKGVYGFDLLAYRYTGNKEQLIKEFVSKVDAPVCVAGSIDCYEKLECVKNSNSWTFTIGGAFFENKFSGSFSDQINEVCRFMKQ